MQVVTIDSTQIKNPLYTRELCLHLEQGNILVLQETPFLPTGEDADFLRSLQQSQSKTHKNIAYKPSLHKVTGAVCSSEEEAQRLKRILAHYSQSALEFLHTLLPPYAATWRVDYASFRPFEEAGRPLPLRHRNDLLHIDAFPTRPTHGSRLLRAFSNLHPTKERVWATAGSFEEIAARYAMKAGLRQVTGRWASIRRHGNRIARWLGVHVPERSPYDEFMLRFHHYLKSNQEFQQEGRRAVTAFAPGVTWISFTDQVTHAVLSGQFALEQTCMVSLNALFMPERSPLAILEQMAGTRLVSQPAVQAPHTKPEGRSPI
jgi:hypothetical protein